MVLALVFPVVAAAQDEVLASEAPPDASDCPDVGRPSTGIAVGEDLLNTSNDFGIDGNLYPNSPAGFPAHKDWTDYIDSSGNPTELLTFHPTDGLGNGDMTGFFTGVKFFEDPNTWQWHNGVGPGKDDIQNGYVRFVTDDLDNVWILMGGDRDATTGASYIDFEILQAPLTTTDDGDGTGGFLSLGPDGGRTVGDLLFTVKLTNGGDNPLFFAQRWSPDTLNVGEFIYYEVCFQDFPSTPAFVAENEDSSVAVPWTVFGTNSYDQYAFAEAGVNLSAMLGEAFNECFGISTVFIRTKSSFSDNSELKDFIEPFAPNFCLDETPPSLVGCPLDLTVECEDAWSFGPAPTGIDNCDTSVVVTFQDGPVLGSCPATQTRTWTATDDCGNTATCSQTVTINDTTNPYISCPAGVTVQCLDDVPGPNTSLVTATDNCDDTPTVTHVGDTSPSGSCPATIVRTYRATDDCGNSSTCTQTITINDTTDPYISCPAGVTVQCLDDVPGANTSLVTATDNCDDTPTVTHVGDSNPSGSCPATIVRTYRATDDCGNSSTCTQTITVDDTIDPYILCPTAIRVECGEDVPEPNPSSVTATDNCDDNPTVEWVNDTDPQQGVCPMVFYRTYRATDDCGNSSTCSQTITVECCQNNVFCTVTQGFYGNEGGKKCSELPGGYIGASTREILEAILPVTVGVVGTRSMTIENTNEGVDAVLILLPGGGPAKDLPDFGDATVHKYSDIYADVSNKGPNSLWDDGQIRSKSGRLANILLAQTLTLALNTEWDNALGGWELTEMFMTTADVDRGDLLCDTSDDTVDDDCDPYPSTYHIGTQVYNLLVSEYGATPTVYDLLDLCNRALAGEDLGVDLSKLAGAADAINRGFDECRGLVHCDPTAITERRRNFTELDRGPEFGAIPMQFGLSPNFPNPAQAATNIRFALPEQSQVRLTVYNVQGQVVSVLVDEIMSAGYKDVRLDAQAGRLPSGIYLYRLDAKGLETGKAFKQTRKMMLMR